MAHACRTRHACQAMHANQTINASHAGGNPAVSHGNVNRVNGFCAKVNATNRDTVGK